MANRDLRDWIEGVRAAGELKVITGAEPKEEIGGIVDIYMRKMGNPAVLFDDVPGFPKGHRVIANSLTSIPRVNLALGLPPETAEMEQIQWWRNYFKRAPSQPTKAVNGGPLLDNVFAGRDVDIEKIPTPVWHEHDGGPYIGTGCLVAMKDPDSGWINYGTYRVQSHEPNVASVMMSPGKHGLIIMRKYHERGQPCPGAGVAGIHPVLMMPGGVEPARSGGHPRRAGRVDARSRRQPLHARDLDQDALRRAFQAGRHGGGALPRRRLQQPLDHRRGRRHRSDQLQRRGVGDVYALRSARSGRYHPRRMELGARPDVLRRRDRPAQFARDHRRLHSVPAQEDLPGHRPFEQGARRPHPRKVGEGFAEGLLITPIVKIRRPRAAGRRMRWQCGT